MTMTIRLKKLSVLLAAAALGSVLVSPALLRVQAAAAQETATKTARPWLGHEQEYEDWLRNTEIISTTGTGEGVTHPQKGAVAPGGLSPFIIFKPIPPGPYNGAMESYKSEIAAYELDKILKLGMVPPVVEKVYKKQKGAAVFWLVGTKNFNQLGSKGGAPTPPASIGPEKTDAYNRALVKAKMFHNLTGDQDPNLGNWLVDDDWNLYIIDFSRALFGDTTMPHKLNHIDKELWDKMMALTVESLTPTLSPWMSKGDIKSIIQRRDILKKQIDDLVKKNGEANVFIK